MNKLKILSLTAALFLATASSVSAQDLIARQAPVDRKLKSIDSLVLKKQIEKEAAEYAASVDIYPSWNNDFVHVYGGVPLPENFRIDLRGFSMPTSNRVVTSRFGYRSRWRRNHKGLDIDVNVGDTIYAAFDGKVRVVKYERGGYGKYVVLRHPNGLETIYGHMSAWLVEPNEEVKSGQPIGLGGNTGRSTGSHLHFEVRVLSKAINPELLFDFPNQDVTADYYVFNPVTPTEGTTVSAKNTAEENTEEAAGATSPYYKVRKGDSLYKIAKRYGITVEKLCKLNGLTKRSVLRPGLVLRCS
ncbi:MAG: peptidoglycan DD-metalloendopeptidase family protein [Bacteroidaceae bacterium]|jgi:murein DD-endopeptidase MepM/ murein hydrolase activator NlpD